MILHLFAQGASDEAIKQSAFQTIQITRGVSPSFEGYSSALSSLLLNVLRGEDVRASVELCADEALGRECLLLLLLLLLLLYRLMRMCVVINNKMV